MKRRERREAVRVSSRTMRGQAGAAARPLAAHAGAVHEVGALPVHQRLELEATPRVVLEQDLAAAEADPPAGRAAAAPERGVAPQDQEDRGHARGGEPAPERQALGHADHRAQLAACGCRAGGAACAGSPRRCARSCGPPSGRSCARGGRGRRRASRRGRRGWRPTRCARGAAAVAPPRGSRWRVPASRDERVGSPLGARPAHHEDIAGGGLRGRGEACADHGSQQEAPATEGHLGSQRVGRVEVAWVAGCFHYAPPSLRALGLLCTAVLVACGLLLAACGGGDDQEEVTKLLDRAFDKSLESADINLDSTVRVRGIPQVERPIRIQASGPYRSTEGQAAGVRHRPEDRRRRGRGVDRHRPGLGGRPLVHQVPGRLLRGAAQARWRRPTRPSRAAATAARRSRAPG